MNIDAICQTAGVRCDERLTGDRLNHVVELLRATKYIDDKISALTALWFYIDTVIYDGWSIMMVFGHLLVRGMAAAINIKRNRIDMCIQNHCKSYSANDFELCYGGLLGNTAKCKNECCEAITALLPQPIAEEICAEFTPA